MNAALGVRFLDRVVLAPRAVAELVDRADAERFAVARVVVRETALLVLLRRAEVAADVLRADVLFLAVVLVRPVLVDRAVVLLVRLATLAGMGFAPGHASGGGWRNPHGSGSVESRPSRCDF